MEHISNVILASLVAIIACLVYRSMSCDNYQEIHRLENLLIELQGHHNQTSAVLEELRNIVNEKTEGLAEQQIKEVNRLETLLVSLKRRQNQKAEILKFFINDVNDRLKTISKKDSQPKAPRISDLLAYYHVDNYECYHWTPQDLDNIHLNYSIAVEKSQCEYYPSNVFTKGKNEQFPGCDNCWCCTKVVRMPPPREIKKDKTKSRND